MDPGIFSMDLSLSQNDTNMEVRISICILKAIKY